MNADHMVGMLRNTIVALVKRQGPDLTARQLAVFLTCYLEADSQTVRGLAAGLLVSKPAITRALDRLAQFDLVRRKRDLSDRRSVLVQRTMKGNGLLQDITRILRAAAAEVDKQPRSRRRSTHVTDIV